MHNDYATAPAVAPEQGGGVAEELAYRLLQQQLTAEFGHFALKTHETVERDMVAVRVGPDLRTVVVGTSDYFARHPRPDTPADLGAHRCVNYRLVGGGRLLPWEFARDGREVRVRASGQLIANDGDLAAAAVRAAAGLGYMLQDEVADDIAADRLIQVLDSWCPPFPGCDLYYPDRQVSPAMRSLVEALRWRDGATR